MAVACSAVVFVFLLVCPVFSYIPAISFTIDVLLDIRQYTPPNISPVLNYSDVLLDIVVVVAMLIKRFMTRKRGKRVGVLVKLRQRGFRTALPSIHLANLHSLPNKTAKLLLLSRTNKDFSNSAALCFTETWLNDAIPDSALSLPGFQLFRAVRRRINSEIAWWQDMFLHQRKVVYRCNSVKEDEALFINCKPLYSPREIYSYILVSVYIPPQAHVSSAYSLIRSQTQNNNTRTLF